ncbi:MAG: hypothetical protein D3903_19060 [Candidatus Electrothrix sp. GM3_4]|nr:hypothetical protein [Candidatus Electrothrix sp. GM3_4]
MVWLIYIKLHKAAPAQCEAVLSIPEIQHRAAEIEAVKKRKGGAVLRVTGWLWLGKKFVMVPESSFGFALPRTIHSAERGEGAAGGR